MITVQNLTAVAGVTWVSLNWDPLANFDQVAGFTVVRKEGSVAPTSVTDGVLVYIGRKNRVGDLTGTTNTAELIYADKGLKENQLYSYSVFTQGLESNYSEPATVSVTTGSGSSNLLINGDFSNGMTNWTLSSLAKVVVNTNQDTFVPITNYARIVPDLTGVEASSFYQTIQIPGGLKPGMLYSLSVWMRANNPDFSPTVYVSGGSGSVTISQVEQSITNENTTTCPVGTQGTFTPSYDRGPVTYSYLDPSQADMWQQIGLTVMTGSKDATPAIYNNGYGHPAQEVTSFGDAIVVEFQIAKCSPGLAGCNTAYIDVAEVEFVEGLIPYTDHFWMVTEGSNLIINPTFLGANNAAYNWVLSNGIIQNGYVTLQPSPANGHAQIMQNMYWMTLPGNVEYTLSFDVMFDTEENYEKLTVLVLDMMQAVQYQTQINWVNNWQTQTITFTTKEPFSPTIVFYAERDSVSYSVDIRNVAFLSTGKESYGLQFQNPTITYQPVTTNATDQANAAIVWKFPAKDPSKTVLSQLFNETAQSGSGTSLGSSQGLVVLSLMGSVPDNLNLVQDTDGGQVLSIQAFGNKASSNSRTGSVLMTSNYFGSGKFDVWVKVGALEGGTGDPLGCVFASWIFNYVSYFGSLSANLLLDASPVRNSEIDIEIPGDCPINVQPENWSYSVGRLNNWGGQWGGEGGNATVHWKMPNGITLNDGQYHKLSILLNMGNDLPISAATPNADYPVMRTPGFIKWFIDDQPWGLGWTGNTYGFDNIPETACRFVFGPWFPGSEKSSWAGVADFDHVTFYIKQAQFTPLCTTNVDDTTLPGSNGLNVGVSNRDTWKTEFKPWVYYNPNQ